VAIDQEAAPDLACASARCGTPDEHDLAAGDLRRMGE